ncbi:MAG: GtrA family protein [Bacilli bacterium]|nr:GtrA family protein [Bacilli bacterium]
MVKYFVNLYKKYNQKYHFDQFIRFVLVGLLATGIDYLVYRLLLNLVGKDIAYTLGFITSLAFNLILSHVFTFKKDVTALSGVKFIIAHFINYLIRLGFLNLFTLVGVPEKYAPLPTYVIAIPINFIVVRFALTFSFRKGELKNEESSDET